MPVVNDLATRFSGELVQPSDPAYDEHRKVHNGLVDKRPGLIARCRTAEDVAAAVRFGRSTGLEIAVRGGGHNPAGRAVCDGGLVVDLSLMRGVAVDADARVARAAGGATWRDVNAATGVYGLGVTSGAVSSTGIGGLTLGGGIGYMLGLHGLAIDNLQSVQLVLADGRIVTASDRDHPDLFWAVRGGGGNFGVATTFEFRLHPIEHLHGGLIVYPFSEATNLLRLFRDLAADCPDDLELFAAFVHAPDGSGARLAAFAFGHFGSPAEAGRAIEAMRGLGPRALDTAGPMTYAALNSMLDDGFPRGALNYWKSSFLQSLSDPAIDTLVRTFADCPTPMGQFIVEHIHGAMTRVPQTATAFPHRSEGFNLAIVTQWMDPAQTGASIGWTRSTHAAMQPFYRDARYVNYLDHDEGGDPAAQAYGPNYARLQQIKRQYDPDNVFHLNQNIRPAS